MYLEVVPVPAVEPLAFDVVAEANHRIANNLSIISGLVRIHGAAICKEPRMMSGDDVRLILEEVGSRLDAVARLHRLLAAGRHEAPINIADFLREIVESAVSALSIGWRLSFSLTSVLDATFPRKRHWRLVSSPANW